MKILVFSDSHGKIKKMEKAIRSNKDIDMIFHLGDMVSDALSVRKLLPDIPIKFVRGNNDWGLNYKFENVLEIETKKILITHGHMYNVKYDYQRIVNKGKAHEVDAVLFGHTHRMEEFYKDGILFLNPGSIGSPIYPDRNTYCLLTVTEEKIISRILSVN
jgi:uncharacterized protein